MTTVRPLRQDAVRNRERPIDAALGPLADQATQIAERAAGAPDAWDALVSFIEGVCGLLAADRGYTDVHRSPVPGTPVIDAALKRTTALKVAIVTRAKAAGVLRADVEPSDLVLIFWGIAAIADATRDTAPDAWRRHLALTLDGLRPGAAHPLPVPAVNVGQLRDTPPT